MFLFVFGPVWLSQIDHVASVKRSPSPLLVLVGESFVFRWKVPEHIYHEKNEKAKDDHKKRIVTQDPYDDGR